mgnify:CR=1 FL=1|jgi:hypothetical protein
MDIEEKNNEMTLGSLFDGIGGFPFAATIVGIKPIWASEIDPACIAVTKNRFPDIEHLGSITDIDGAKIPPVDVITFGSPCQDLSVAGKQVGLDGERSGLFKEAIRIIYEMRSATNGKYPSFIIWENVPGAFSSNNGRDFRTVLEEITKTDIPMPSSGKWATAGVVRGGRFVPRGDNLTLNIGECPSEESASTLSEVLGVIVPKKYYLSATACAGILRRAERRGKELPPQLKEALISVVNASTQEETAVTEESLQ